jgi:hypothetical protein
MVRSPGRQDSRILGQFVSLIQGWAEAPEA